MKKLPKTQRPSKQTSTKMDERSFKGMAERTQMSLALLKQLALTTAANEKVQRRFRTAILIRVSRIETIVQLIHGAQIAQAHNCIDEEKIRRHADDAEKFISEASNRLGLAMVDYIYGELGEVTPPRRDGRRKWSDWEI